MWDLFFSPVLCFSSAGLQGCLETVASFGLDLWKMGVAKAFFAILHAPHQKHSSAGFVTSRYNMIEINCIIQLGKTYQHINYNMNNNNNIKIVLFYIVIDIINL